MISGSSNSQPPEFLSQAHALSYGVPLSESESECFLRTLIQQHEIAQLICFQTQHHEAVAKVCFDLVESHPDEVAAVLWDGDVAVHVLNTLCQMPSTGQRQARALAVALLRAGQGIKNERGEVPSVLKEWWKNREGRIDDYALRKALERDSDNLEASFKPRFYLHPEMPSDINLNGKRGWCGQLVMGAEKYPKTFMKQIGGRAMSDAELGLLYENLEERMKTSAPYTVQFSPESLGVLLKLICTAMPLGEAPHAFLVTYSHGEEVASGHAMLLYLKKTLDGAKVYFYEPNVTQNMMHQWVPFECLDQLSLETFDQRAICRQHNVRVLSMDLRATRVALGQAYQSLRPEEMVLTTEMEQCAAKMARELACSFVAPDTETQMQAFAEALARGNVAVFKAMDESSANWCHTVSISRVRHGISSAIRLGYAEIIQLLADSSLIASLDLGSLRNMLFVDGVSIFRTAMNMKDVNTIRSVGRLLYRVSDVLSDADLTELLLAKGSEGAPGFYDVLELGWLEGVNAVGEVLKLFKHRLTSQDMAHLLAARAGDGQHGLHMSLQEGHAGAITAFLGLLEHFDGLGEERSFGLLKAPNSDDQPGLAIALYLDREEAVAAFVEALKKFEGIFSPELIDEVLQARVGSLTGWEIACEQGSHRAVDRFFQAVEKGQLPLSKRRQAK